MEEILRIVLDSGRSAVELALYVLLPVLVLMMAVMRLLEARGVLAFIARLLGPVLRIFGIPGAGVFAMLQLLFVSFAAPASTLALMDRDGTSRRGIAATLAMILAMSQANAVFPMLAVGLSLPWILLTSLVGGFAAAAVTYHLLMRSERDEPAAAFPRPPEGEAAAALPRPPEGESKEPERAKSLPLLLDGGQEGLQLALRSIPILVLAICLVKLLEAAGAISLLERALSPLLATVGLTGVTILPLVTKYLAGGTAMMGVAMNLVQEGAMSAVELNRIAGLITNPLDVVGIAVLAAAGTRVAGVVRPAIVGGLFGILIRGILHLLIF